MLRELTSLARIETLSIKTDILAALSGGKPQRVPWNIHHALLPRGTLERTLRNSGLGIVEKSVPAYQVVSAQVSVEERQGFEDGRLTFHITHHTPVGHLHTQKVIGPDGSLWVTGYPVKKPEHMRILEYITEHTEYHPNDAAIRGRQQTLGDDGLVLCRLVRSPFQRLLIEWMGVEGVILGLAGHGAEIEHLLECMSAADEAAFAIAASSPAEALWSAENITCLITTPKFFERYCLPYYNRLASLAHAGGKLYGVHMDGRLRALGSLIAGSELDFIEGFTPPPLGNLPLEEAREAWPGKALWVNFPGCELYRGAEELVEYIADLVKRGMAGGSFLLSLTEDFPEPERTLRLVAEGVARYESQSG